MAAGVRSDVKPAMTIDSFPLRKCPTTGPVLISCGVCLACSKRDYKCRGAYVADQNYAHPSPTRSSATGPVKFRMTEDQIVNGMRLEIRGVSVLLNFDKWMMVVLCDVAGYSSQFHCGEG